MKVLGISCFYHDSAACLIVDGQIIGAAAEERFSRKKHDNDFPGLTIEYCLEKAGLAVNELDAIVFYEKPIWKFERTLHQHLEHFPKSYKAFFDTTGSWINQKLSIKKILHGELNYSGEVVFLPHHLSHAASAYYLSPFSKSALVTIDGVGEWATTTVGVASKESIKIDQEIRFPHSLGLLYSTVTAYLGFRVNNDEYKVMGLAAYGKKDKYQEAFDELIVVNNDGSYALNMAYFDYAWTQRMPSKKMASLFGYPIRKPESKIYQYHKDIAAALQKKLEEVVFKLLQAAHDKYHVDNLCLSGGVALNSVMNGRILSLTSFKKIFIPPDPGDAGGAMGAALYVTLNPSVVKNYVGRKKQPVVKHKRIASTFTPYLGPDYTRRQVETTLQKYKSQLKYKYFPDQEELLETTSDLIIKKQVIGWFQGRMEWGPRALGNRSILADATDPKMKDILNAKVKHREMFRPFAPVILEEHVPDYFEADKPLPVITKYMLMVYPFTEKGKKDIFSVVHVNGSGRLQSISRKDNPLYYSLIENYYKKTGIPVITNTSFNVRGEPIVCSPVDAIRCFLGTGIDYLVIDQYIINKRRIISKK
jgi:carbamoyltransferase